MERTFRDVNGSTMACNSGGDLYQDLPGAQAGGYCVHMHHRVEKAADGLSLPTGAAARDD